MVCALTSSMIKGLSFLCSCLSVTFRVRPHSSFLTFSFVCESYTFCDFTVGGYFYLYIVAFFLFEMCAPP